MTGQAVTEAAQKLSKACDAQIKKLIGQGGAKFVTNPLDYAWVLHEQYLDIAAKGDAKNSTLGNEPWTMGDGSIWDSIWSYRHGKENWNQIQTAQ